MKDDTSLDSLRKAQFDSAKRFWLLEHICRLTAVTVSILAIFTTWPDWMFGLVAALCTIFYVIFQWFSDYYQSRADSILRKIEMWNGLGWAITTKEISDLLVDAPKALSNNQGGSNYFSSGASQSIKRVLENLEESTWYTKHQAKRMSIFLFITSCVGILVAFFTLFISLQNAITQPTASTIADITMSVVVFMFSGGYIRLAYKYLRLFQQAERIEDITYSMIQESLTKDIADIQAIKLLHDYQIIRAKSPMLPNWLWTLMEKRLNTLWREHRQRAKVAIK